jgi:hypothetical protein
VPGGRDFAAESCATNASSPRCGQRCLTNPGWEALIRRTPITSSRPVLCGQLASAVSVWCLRTGQYSNDGNRLRRCTTVSLGRPYGSLEKRDPIPLQGPLTALSGHRVTSALCQYQTL